VSPVKTRQAKPLYLTFACLRLPTCLPTGCLLSFLLCPSACAIVPNDIGHVSRLGPSILPAISCRHRNFGALVFLSLLPSYFSLHCERERRLVLFVFPFSVGGFLGLGLRILQAFSAATPASLDQNGYVQGSGVGRDRDSWCRRRAFQW
jgi:hypothetical protein